MLDEARPRESISATIKSILSTPRARARQPDHDWIPVDRGDPAKGLHVGCGGNRRLPDAGTDVEELDRFFGMRQVEHACAQSAGAAFDHVKPFQPIVGVGHRQPLDYRVNQHTGK